MSRVTAIDRRDNRITHIDAEALRIFDVASRRLPPLVPVAADNDHIIRLKQVIARTGMCKSSIYREIERGSFPAQVKLGRKAVGWRNSEISAWIAGDSTGGEQ